MSDGGNDANRRASAPIAAQVLTAQLAGEVDHEKCPDHVAAGDHPPRAPDLSDLRMLAEINVSRDDLTSNRGAIGAPLTLARRATLRLLRPFLQLLLTHVTTFNRAVVDELASEHSRRAHEMAALHSRLASELQAARSDLDAVCALAAAAEHQIRQLESFASTIDERLMPTIFTVGSLRTIDDAGRSTIGFSGDAGTIGSPYAAFETAFRGPRERVSDLLKPYIAAFDGCAHVLDAGCGRGEFIEMLNARGVRATGVDLDGGMLSAARERDLDVHQADAVGWLRANPAVYDGLFSSQVVEHMTFEALADMLSTAASSLRPNSVVIIETVNPYCAAGLQAFRTDPTHTALVFPEVLAVLAQAAGFARATVTFPCEWSAFDEIRRTSPSYALVARTQAP